jgi:MFS transporter, OFA family, oxalate/formate antiporter
MIGAEIGSKGYWYLTIRAPGPVGKGLMRLIPTTDDLIRGNRVLGASLFGRDTSMGILDTDTDPQPGQRKLQRCHHVPILSRQAEAFATRGRGVSSITSGATVVAAVFCLVFLLMGTAFSFSIFAPELQRELNAGSGSISLIFGCAMALLYGGGCLSGILADRIGTHWVAGAGALLAGGALVAGGMVRTVWQADLALGLGFGLGLAVSYSPAVAAVQPWFSRNRGVASGIALSGTGLGTLLMPLFAEWFINAYGWRTALTIIGLGVAGLGLVVSNWIRRPLGLPAPRRAHSSLWRIARAPTFRRLYVAGFLSSFALLVPIVEMASHAVRGGITPRDATWLISILGFGSIAGRLILSHAADRLGRQSTLGALHIVLGVLFLLWTVHVGFGAIALRPAVIADQFAGPNLGAVTGLHYTSSTFGTLLGPAAFGYSVDFWNSDLVPVCMAAACLFGAAYFFAPRPPQARYGWLFHRQKAALKGHSGQACQSALRLVRIGVHI